MWKNRILVVLSFLSVFFSCNSDKEEDYPLPPHVESILIECYLEPGQPYRALVSKTMNFFDSVENEPADDLKISIFNDGIEKVLENAESADTLYNKVYNYFYPEEVVYEEGREYQISVNYGNRVAAIGKTQFLQKPKIKNIEFKFHPEIDSLAALFVEIEDDPGKNNFYRLVVRGLNPAEGQTYEGIWDDKAATNGSFTAFTGFDFLARWSLVVNVYHLEEKYYNFLKSVSQARESNYNPFMQPASIQTNLDGATGIFTTISLTSDTVKFTK